MMRLLEVFKSIFFILLFTKLFLKEFFSLNTVFMLFLSIIVVFCALLILIIELYSKKDKTTPFNHKPLHDGIPFFMFSLLLLLTDILPSDTLFHYRWIGVALALFIGVLFLYPIIRSLPKK
jgi:uncharacterized membrane protein